MVVESGTGFWQQGLGCVEVGVAFIMLWMLGQCLLNYMLLLLLGAELGTDAVAVELADEI